jgi:hypothetical protein
MVPLKQGGLGTTDPKVHGYLPFGVVRCAFSGKNLHSRMPLDPTPVRLKLLQACDQ